MLILRNFKWFVIIFVVLILGTTGFAFASSNMVIAAKDGDGSGAISGYAVSNIHYVLSADPSRIELVSFSLDAPATTVKVRLISSTANYYVCSNTSANNWGCSLSSPAVSLADANELRVVAAQ
jgi:hypothetical protein